MSTSTEWGERKTGASKSEVESGKWIAVQKRIFTRWANAYLKARKMKVADLCTDLQDGVKLINLLEILSGESVGKYRKNPKMEIHKRENLKAAFEFMARKGLRLTNVGSVDVFDGNEKIILGLFWTIISKFQVDEISVEGVSGKDALKLWCTHKTLGYDNVEIKNFHRSWKDGLAFCALIHKHRPGIIDYDSLSKDNPAENLALAFQLAEDYFGIDRILDVEDIVDSVKPDEKIVITYVAFVFKGLAEFLRRLALAKSVGKAINITEKHDAWIAECTEKATALHDWMAETQASYDGAELGNTAAAVKEMLDNYNYYLSGVKPEWKQKRLELEGLYNTFFASARNNDRPKYQPPTGLSKEELREQWTALEAAEAAYETKVRTQYRTYLQVESAIDKFNAKVGKLNEWMTAQSEVFSSGEYGANLVSTETLITAYEAFETQLAQQQQTVETVTAWAATDGIETHEQCAATQTALAEVQATLAAIVEQGTTYRLYLEMTRESHEKFGKLDEVAAWIAKKQEFFASGQYGEALVDTNALLEQFQAWPTQVAPQAEAVESMTSEQEAITERVAAEQASLDALRESAETYHTYLLCQQEYFEKMATLETLAGWINGQSAIFVAEDYGDDLASTNNNLSLFNETFKVAYPAKREALDAMETYQDEIQTQIDAKKADMDALQEQADYYENQLLLAQERFEKLPLLSRVEAWIHQQNEVFAQANYGEALEAVETLLASFKSYTATAAQHREALGTMESNQDTINEPLASLREAFATMDGAAAQYQQELLLNQERLLQLPVLERVEGWIGQQNELFAKAEYGVDQASTATLLEAHQTFPADLTHQQQIVGDITTEQDVVKSKLEAVQAALAAVEAAGDEYHTQLLLSQERFEKLPILEGLAAWINQQLELFSTEDFGDTLSAVDALLSAFNTYTVSAQTKAETLNGMETYQQAIQDVLDATKESMASLESTAEWYHTQLLLSQERLEKLPQLDRADAWLDRQNALFAAADYGENKQDAELLLTSYDFVRNAFPATKELLDNMESYQDVINDALANAKAKMEATEAAAAEYELQLNLSIERHEKLPRLARVFAWISRQQELFSAANYGDSLAAVDLLKRSFQETYTATLPVQKEVLAEMESEQEAILTKLQEAKDALAAVEDSATEYTRQLDLAVERFEKFPTIDRVEGWLEAHAAVFARRDYGEASLAAVNVHIANFEESFTLHLANKKAVFESVESDQEAIKERITEVEQLFRETEAAAAEYSVQLEQCKERHIKLPQLDHVDQWLDAQHAVFVSGEYGEGVVDVADKLASFDAYRSMLLLQKAVGDNMSSEQDAVTSRIAEIAAKLQAVDEAGEEYHTQLLLSQERLQKLPTIALVRQWLEAQGAVFEAGDYGSTQAEVTNKLSEHESFDANLGPQKLTLENIETYQEAISTELNDVKALAAAVEEAGSTYKIYLLLTQERLEKWPMLDRVQAWHDKFKELFDAGDYGDSLRSVAEKLSEFETFPAALAAQQEIVNNMESNQDDIVARVEELKTALATLSESSEVYQNQLLLCQERLEKLPALERMNTWLDEQRTRFSSGDVGASIVEVSTLLSGHDAFKASAAAKKDSLDAMQSYQDEILTPLAASKEFYDGVATEADAYGQQLALNQERLQKLPQLDEVDSWLAERQALFDRAHYGTTLVEVATLLSSHAEGFKANLPAKKELLESMTTEQEEIATRLAASRASMAAVEEAADAYETGILLSQERLEKLPLLDRVEEWLNTTDALFAGAVYGTTLVEVATLLASYDTLKLSMTAKQETLNAMESYQDVINERLAAMRERMTATEAAAEQYQYQLLVTQERLQKIPALDRILAWLGEQAAAFASDNFGSTLREVRELRAVKRNYERGAAPHTETVDHMETYQDEILAKIAEVKAKMEEVTAAAQAFEQSLDAQEAHLQNIMSLNKQYNAKADSFTFDVSDLADELGEPIPVLLSALEELWAKFTTQVQPRLDTITTAYQELEALSNQLTEAGAEDAFSRFTLTALYESYADVYGRMGTREEELGGALTAERERDAKRIEFAEKATDLREFADAMTKKVGALAGTLQEQLEGLQALQAEFEACAKLNDVYECATAMEEAGIVDNPHTNESYHSLFAVWDGLEKVFSQADESLQAQLLAERDEHITPEQYKEIKEVFNHFDLNGDDQLDPTEFSYCCTSIGLVLTKEEILTKMAELDGTGDGCVNFQEFTTFMMERLVEPGHTKADVMEAFRALGEGEEYVTKRILVTSFTNESHLDYVVERLPVVEIPAEEGEVCMVYGDFVDELFTR